MDLDWLASCDETVSTTGVAITLFFLFEVIVVGVLLLVARPRVVPRVLNVRCRRECLTSST